MTTNRLDRWAVWSVCAFTATAAHALIDQHIGLYGETSEAMSGWEALNVARLAVLFGFWLLVTYAAVESPDARRALLWLAVIDAAILNGAVAFVAAPPPSAAFPYQDITHGLALVTGVGAARSIHTSLSELEPPTERRWRVATVLVLVGVQVAGTAYFASTGMFG